MNPIIKHSGEYLTNYFVGEKGTWEIVSTDSGEGGPMTCIDTFLNRTTGDKLPVKREKVFIWAESGSIHIDPKKLKSSTSKKRAA
jgi:hypothetical protein